jgi:hypothetical protein
MITNELFRQMAYVVADIQEAARKHSELFGSGPFFVAKKIPFRSSIYRGKSMPFVHSAAFGQWGDMQVEFMQREDDQPSVLTEVLEITGGRPSTHHKAIIIPDPGKAAHAFETAGYPIAWEGVMEVGIEVYMVDTRALYGHMIELYEPSAMVDSFYAMVKSAAVGFDGADPVRDFAF